MRDRGAFLSQVSEGHLPVAAALLRRHGADPNLANDNGSTPLFWATSKVRLPAQRRCLCQLSAGVYASPAPVFMPAQRRCLCQLSAGVYASSAPWPRGSRQLSAAAPRRRRWRGCSSCAAPRRGGPTPTAPPRRAGTSSSAGFDEGLPSFFLPDFAHTDNPCR
jgi:hypothetical protein